MDRTLRRDPKNRDHKMTRDEVVCAGPEFLISIAISRRSERPNFTATQRRQSGILQTGERRDCDASRWMR